MSVFEKYSAFYNLLYSDKNYSAESEYIAGLIRSSTPDARSILELGCGTGRHGRLLAAMGFDVHGIERSPEMALVAQRSVESDPSNSPGRFSCEVGDIRTAKVGRVFDAVISLFHVMSYQTSNEELQQAFKVASDHLAPGGLFVFDVWHGPAVLSQGPAKRTKEMTDGRYRVKRTAYPELDSNRSTVKVLYDLDCEDRLQGQQVRFKEEHVMRYLFPTEVDLLADICGLRRVLTEEFLSRDPPSPSTWGVTYVLQKGLPVGVGD